MSSQHTTNNCNQRNIWQYYAIPDIGSSSGGAPLDNEGPFEHCVICGAIQDSKLSWVQYARSFVRHPPPNTFFWSTVDGSPLGGIYIAVMDIYAQEWRSCHLPYSHFCQANPVHCTKTSWRFHADVDVQYELENMFSCC